MPVPALLLCLTVLFGSQCNTEKDEACVTFEETKKTLAEEGYTLNLGHMFIKVPEEDKDRTGFTTLSYWAHYGKPLVVVQDVDFDKNTPWDTTTCSAYRSEKPQDSLKYLPDIKTPGKLQATYKH